MSFIFIISSLYGTIPLHTNPSKSENIKKTEKYVDCQE